MERGYLLVPAALGTMEGGDPSSALALFGEAVEVGNRFGDHDLVTLGRLGQGAAAAVRSGGPARLQAGCKVEGPACPP